MYLKVNHPTNPECKDLLLTKQVDLQKAIRTHEIECTGDNRVNSVLRGAIRSKFNSDLELTEIELDVANKEGDLKSIWSQLQSYLPLYSLFQSDRKNSDGDSEIQDPLKEAVKQIIADGGLQVKLNEIADEIKMKLEDVASRTLQKLHELSPEISETLIPQIPNSSALKWADVFKNVSISGDNNIPINKRGSGVKRLVLLSFFRAEAERRQQNNQSQSIIYAIEEPETSQHKANQNRLIDAFISLASIQNTQIIMTTHSADIVKKLQFENLRLIDGIQNKTVVNVDVNSLPYPSLNEVNYLAFCDVSEEYHNELYGYLEIEGLLSDFKLKKSTMPYIKIKKVKITDEIQRTHVQCILTEYIRHQIHHPENNENVRFTEDQLKESINLMRDFIIVHHV